MTDRPHPLRRFSTKELMLMVGMVALILGLMRESIVLGLTFCFWLIPASMAIATFRGIPASAWAPWIFLGSAVWINVSVGMWVIYESLIEELKIFFLFFLSFLLTPIFFATGLKWASSQTIRNRARASTLVCGLFALALSMVLTGWPLQVAFFLSSPALNGLADRVEAGEKTPPDRWAGVFPLGGVEVNPKNSLAGVSINCRVGGSTSPTFFRQQVPLLRTNRWEVLGSDLRSSQRWTYVRSRGKGFR